MGAVGSKGSEHGIRRAQQVAPSAPEASQIAKLRQELQRKDLEHAKEIKRLKAEHSKEMASRRRLVQKAYLVKPEQDIHTRSSSLALQVL